MVDTRLDYVGEKTNAINEDIEIGVPIFDY